MADPGPSMPYHDLYDDPFTDNLSNILNDYENPSLLDLQSEDHIGGSLPSSSHYPNHRHQHDHVTWNLPIDSNIVDQGLGSGDSDDHHHHQPGPSQIQDQELLNNNNSNIDHDHDRHEVIEENLELPQVNNNNPSDNGNSRPLQTWPFPPIPFNCSCCQVLREIIHVNEFNNYMKLEIHGRLGMICHAICESKTTINNVTATTSENPRFEMFEQSIEDVKRFLVQYCSERKLEGYVMVQDPMSIFYEALCVGLEWDDFSNNDIDFDFLPTTPLNSGGENYGEEQELQQEQVPVQQEQTDFQPPPPPAAHNEGERNPRISLAEQRQRTGKLTLMDLREYLHLTIEEAAKAMNVCPTVLKKICRRSGLPRWPYRKIRSIKRQISSLMPSLESNDANIREKAQAEIDKLRQEATDICAGVDVVGL